jgi:LPS export ABC transporter protein LptC
MKNIFIVIIFAALFSFLSCETDENEVAKITAKKPSFPTLTGKDVDIDYRDSGLVKLKMHAGFLKRYEFNVPEPYYEIDSGLKIIFFDKTGKEISSMSARYGIFYETTKRVEVRYNVVVVNQEGKRLETEKLKWREKDSIRNEGIVYMFQNGRTLRGHKLIASEDFSHMELEDFVIEIPVNDLEKNKEEKK